MNLCIKFHTFDRICKFITLPSLTNRNIFATPVLSVCSLLGNNGDLNCVVVVYTSGDINWMCHRHQNTLYVDGCFLTRTLFLFCDMLGPQNSFLTKLFA